MVVYSTSKAGFCADIISGKLDGKLTSLMKEKTGKGVGKSEVNSWRNSLQFMFTVLSDHEIPDNSGVAIEFHIPNSSRRIDFILSGKGADQRPGLAIIEIKQWDTVEPSSLPSVVVTRLGGSLREVPHPSYQAWSYAQLLKDYCQVIEERNIRVQPCAFLHNYTRDGVIDHPQYSEDLQRAPLFLKEDIEGLRKLLKEIVRHGDESDTIFQIEKGRIRPSKALVDHLASLLKGNAEFQLIDDQKVAYEACVHAAETAQQSPKQVVIVEGGPGTGKSVVAINLLVELTKREQLCQYVSKNSAPRAVYEAMLVGHFKRSRISNLFIGSGAFTKTKKNSFDTLIVDEAHRLNEKSGLYSNLGENQIKEIIHSSRCAIFFIDEDQRVTLKDHGSKEEILYWANRYHAKVLQYSLPSQFRCNGSDGFISWLDNILQLRPTANVTLGKREFDFRVLDSPDQLDSEIQNLNRQSENRARLVAGYCWPWISKKEPNSFDIKFEGFKFKRRWNLTNYGSLWIVHPDSVSEVGCIHTCQGLELDYIGVIIGPDLVVRDGKVVTNFRARARTDQSLKGIKSMPIDEAEKVADQIIKNTYRTLMTRGSKGCLIYSNDIETREHFASALEEPSYPESSESFPHELQLVAEPRAPGKSKKRNR